MNDATKKPRMTAKRLAEALRVEYQRGFDAGQLASKWWEFAIGAAIGGAVSGCILWWLI